MQTTLIHLLLILSGGARLDPFRKRSCAPVGARLRWVGNLSIGFASASCLDDRPSTKKGLSISHKGALRANVCSLCCWRFVRVLIAKLVEYVVHKIFCELLTFEVRGRGW